MTDVTDMIHIRALLEGAVAINGTLTIFPDQCQILLDALDREKRAAEVAQAADAFARKYRDALDLDGRLPHSLVQRLDAAWRAWQAAAKKS